MTTFLITSSHYFFLQKGTWSFRIIFVFFSTGINNKSKTFINNYTFTKSLRRKQKKLLNISILHLLSQVVSTPCFHESECQVQRADQEASDFICTSKENQIIHPGNENMSSFQLKFKIADSELLLLQMHILSM